MAFKIFGTEILTSSDVNTFLMEQSVIRVNNEEERGGLPAEAGMVVYRLDTGTLEAFNGLDWEPVGSGGGGGGDTSDTGWISVDPSDLLTGWSHWTSGGWDGLKIRLKAGVFYVSGALTRSGATPAGSEMVFFISGDYSPTQNVAGSAYSAGVATSAYITPDGVGYIDSPKIGMNLINISYPVGA